MRSQWFRDQHQLKNHSCSSNSTLGILDVKFAQFIRLGNRNQIWATQFWYSKKKWRRSVIKLTLNSKKCRWLKNWLYRWRYSQFPHQLICIRYISLLCRYFSHIEKIDKPSTSIKETTTKDSRNSYQLQCNSLISFEVHQLHSKYLFNHSE